MRDIINNRSRDFITRNANAIAWNKGTTEYVLRGKTIGGLDEALRIIYSQMRHRAISLGHPTIAINFDANGSYTDLTSVWVGLDFIDDPDFSLEQKVDIAKGLLSHEIAHVKYTCRNAQSKFVDNLSEADYELTKTRVFKDIANILEDERIETNLIKAHAGVADDIALVKRRYFSKVLNFNPQGQVQDSLLLLLYAVRYPSSIPQELIDSNASFYAYLCERLDTLYNKTRLTAKKDYEHILRASLDILKLLPVGEGESAEQSVENQKQKVQDLENEKAEAKKAKFEAEQAVDDANAEGAPQEEIDKLIETMKQARDKFREVRDELSETQQNNPLGNGISDAINPLTDEKAERFNELRANHNFGEICEKGKYTKCEANVDKPLVREDSDYSGSLASDELYDEHFNAIKPLMGQLRQAMAMQFDCQNKVVKNLRSGKIKNLVGAYGGRQDVFARKPRMNQQKLNLAILIDESGSMDGEKMQIAKDFAMLFYQTFHNSPNVTLWLYGIRSVGKHQITEEFYSPKTKGEFRKRFRGMIAGGGNDDGHQIVNLVDHVRAHNSEPCVLVCISDGVPSDHDYLKYSVRYAKSKDFFPIQIGIGTMYEEFGNPFFSEWAEVTEKDFRKKPISQVREETIRKFSQVVRAKITSVLG